MNKEMIRTIKMLEAARAKKNSTMETFFYVLIATITVVWLVVMGGIIVQICHQDQVMKVGNQVNHVEPCERANDGR